MFKIILIFASFAAATTPSFEVASVKPNPMQTGPSAIPGTTPGRFTASNTPLRFVILYAYHLMDNQLNDRFGLKVHQERQQQPAYSLTVASKTGRPGRQLRPSGVECPQAGQCRMIATRHSITGGTRTIAQLAATLQSMVERPVIDRTGLTGAFDMDVKWDDNQGPSIFTALQEQLGLKLEPAQDLVETIVIDHVEKPTAN